MRTARALIRRSLIALLATAPLLQAADTATPAADATLWQQPAATLDDPLLRSIGARLSQQPQLARRFEQEKHLKILQRPLRTSGVMLYRAERGICWHTETPIASTLVLEPTQLRQLGDGSNEALVIGAREQPALFGFTQLFFALLAGHVDAAAEQFELRVHGDAAHWQIGLLPRSAQLQRFIARMQLGGGAQLDEVIVTDPEGDRTLIRFSAADPVDPALSLRCFGEPVPTRGDAHD